MDTGCGHDLIAQKKIEKHNLETLVTPEPISFQTAKRDAKLFSILLLLITWLQDRLPSWMRVLLKSNVTAWLAHPMSKLNVRKGDNRRVSWNANTYVDKGEKGKAKARLPKSVKKHVRMHGIVSAGTRQPMKTIHFAVVFVIGYSQVIFTRGRFLR